MAFINYQMKLNSTQLNSTLNTDAGIAGAKPIYTISEIKTLNEFNPAYSHT